MAAEQGPVNTVTYTPDTLPDQKMREIVEETSRTLITDPASLYLGINVSRIVPNPNAAAFMGMQAGDEAKGTWVYRYTEQRPEGGVSLRGGGSKNAGHQYKPRGETEERTNRLTTTADADSWKKVIGRAVLADPEILIKEITVHSQRGFDNSPGVFMVDGQTFLSWKAHEQRDIAEEANRGQNAVGTTKSGVGPAAADYAGREGMNFGMLRLPSHELQQVVLREVERNNRILKALGSKVEFDPQSIYEEMSRYAGILGPYIQNTHSTVVDALKSGNFVFEGAQAFSLGRDTGFPGQVTSTNCGLSTLSLNYRTSENYVGNKIGVMKLIRTHVGNHYNHAPLPTSLLDRFYHRTEERGKPEKGAVSGRPREFSWPSLPELRAAVETYGINQAVIAKGDIADVADWLEFGMEYVFPDGTVTDVYDPGDPRMSDPRTRMNTLKLQGWRRSTAGMRDLQDAPAEVMGAMRTLSYLIGVPVIAFGTGPGYDEYAPVRHSIFDRRIDD